METDSESILCYIDELKAEDINTRLHAINSLEIIASAIGEEKTRSELIPYTNDLIEDETEEVLLALASKLSELPAYLGGSEHIPCLLPPLLSLCANDDQYVQNKAFASLNSICKQIPSADRISLLIPALVSLSDSNRSAGRIAACSLFPSVFKELNLPDQDAMLDLFIKLGCDNSASVRKAAALNLGSLFSICPNEKLTRLFRNLIEDDNDSVKQMTLSSAERIVVDSQELLIIVQKCAVDKSWRIRYAMLENLDKLSEKISSFAGVTKELLGLLRDSESEVRALAALKLPVIANKLPKSVFLSEILPNFDSLSQDLSYHVRLALMQTLCKVGKYIDSQVCIQKLFPLINTLIRDDNFEVRMGFAENFAHFNQSISDKSVLSFSIPIIMQMMNDPRWRIRLKIVECLPIVAEILGVTQFTEQLSAPLMKWVEDPAFGVREVAIQVIFAIANSFGRDWTRLHILPLVEMLVNSPVFSKRMTALKAVNQLAVLLEYEVCSRFLKVLAADKIPNIRFNVMKTVKNMMKIFKIDSEMVRVVESLKRDLDVDVRFYANETAEALAKYN